MSYEDMADREYALNVSRDRPEQAWILSNRDVWYRNPFYTGPAVPHPEDDYDAPGENVTPEGYNKVFIGKVADDDDPEIPF